MSAQEAGLGAGEIEISAFPGGGLIFQESGSGSEPDFANYAIASLGIKQNLSTVDGVVLKEETPNTWLYTGNVVISPIGNDREAAPYVTAGIGGITLLDVTDEQAPVTGLTQNQSRGKRHQATSGRSGAGLLLISTGGTDSPLSG